jgi:hypothetical protein
MIVRILSENQYRLDDAHKDALLNLDEDMLVAIDTDNEARFESLLKEVLAFVQANGQQVPDGELVTSDMIVPAPDMSMEEARKYLEEHPC